jgi:hypothetical protein
MATPYYDSETEGIIYRVQPTDDYGCEQDDSDMDTVSSGSTAQTTSTITSDEISGEYQISFRASSTQIKALFFQDYFREAYGRTYAHDENLPLTYPVDDIEARRHQMQHVFLKALVHGNYIGPVREVLRPRADGLRPRILDIRTCAGDW